MGGQVWPPVCTRDAGRIVKLPWLTPGAGLAALAIGIAVYGGIGHAGLLLLIAFFTTSSLLTVACRRQRATADDDATGRTALQVLANGGVFCLYGPFNYQGRFTSASNERFDDWLKSRDPDSGIRDIEDLCELAEKAGLVLKQDFEMPANNRILYWEKEIE